ncbi:RDD family protein [Lysinibacter cavernae]|uniref:Putative RDD family membrane protein YckC n=1 Tax=Lysinibacter cavernae TaxID=1640652 RepID=A0A7X5TSV6_9MICO|nr:putative RDD family membrane protein YckC [Lysinibacter cavernae]
MPDSTNPPKTFGDAAPSEYPGERLGLPQSGRGSIARIGRRVVALVIDWGYAMLISLAFFNYDALAITVIFIIGQVVFIPTIGGSIGHRLTGLRVISLSGGWVGIWRPVVRTLLLCLILPALIWDSDQRAFHDKIPGTALIIA